MRTCCCFLLLLAAIAAVFSAAAGEDLHPTGEWGPVSYVYNPFIQDMGRWAVAQMHSVLSFYHVTDDTGKDRNYALFILASKRAGAGDDLYRAVVHVTRGLVYQSVLSFHAVKVFNQPPPPKPYGVLTAGADQPDGSR
ncbi:hypothetical protein ACP4OV_003054 [Aristida adscensionis]